MDRPNFTERARKVLLRAREESVRLHHEYVGTEHILLGMIKEGEGVGAVALERLNVDLDEVREQLQKTIRPGLPTAHVGPDLPYTSRAKHVLQLAVEEARALNHRYVGSEHLLLGLIAEGKGIAAQALSFAGVSVEAARNEIQRILGTELAPQGESSVTTAAALLTPPPPGKVERFEVVLHYDDGRRFQASFASAREAHTFLVWVSVRQGE